MEIKMDILVLTVRDKDDNLLAQTGFGGMKSLAKHLRKEYRLDGDEIDFLDMEGRFDTPLRSFLLYPIPFTAELPVDL
jgi:hypothetical protein